MKNLLKIMFLFTLASCKSQEQVVDIFNRNGDSDSGFYYKDIQNFLDTFEGTYLYSNGSTSFKIVLQKKIMSNVWNNVCHEDLIIGEYRFVKDGIEVINTLNNLNTFYSNGRFYKIHGNSIIGYGSPGCPECSLNEKALRLSIIDENSDNSGDLFIRRIIVGGQPALSVSLRWFGPRWHHVEMPEPLPPSIPATDFIMIKI